MASLFSKKTSPKFARVALVGKYQAEGIESILNNIAKLIKSCGCEVFFEAETASSIGLDTNLALAAEDFAGQIDAVVVVGGDGTLLGIGRKIAGANIPVIGINMGRLGYMTDIPLQEINTVLPDLLSGRYESDTRHLLEASIIHRDQVVAKGLALNDVVMNRSSISGMVELTVSVNGSFMYNQRSDGLIVSTPTGSTAYSLSAGGPILHPRVFGIVLAPIAPHALSNRPIVLPADAEITIEVAGGKDVSVNFDMQSLTLLQIGDKVLVKKSDKTVTLLHPVGHSDYRTLREKLHWNEYPSSF
jgi:NAD+ kinase